MVKTGEPGAFLLFESGDVGELAHVVEHEAEIVVEGGEIFDGFIFIFLFLL